MEDDLVAAKAVVLSLRDVLRLTANKVALVLMWDGLREWTSNAVRTKMGEGRGGEG